jgi:opacity protein-like surface antigen
MASEPENSEMQMRSALQTSILCPARHRLLLVTLMLTFAAVSSANAQISIGAKGGINVANFSVTENGGEPELPYDSRTGLLFGATVGVTVTPWLTVQLEGRYSQKGTKQTDNDVIVSLNLWYVDVPLVAKAYIPTNGSPVMPYLYVGGFMGFETGCGVTASGAVSLDLSCETADVGRQTNDYGVVFGGGTDVRLGPGAVTLDIEYSLGLRNLAEDPNTGEAHSRVFAFAAGYKLFL